MPAKFGGNIWDFSAQQPLTALKNGQRSMSMYVLGRACRYPNAERVLGHYEESHTHPIARYVCLSTETRLRIAAVCY